MSVYVHFDEARRESIKRISEAIESGAIDRAVLIDDLFGRLRLVIWPEAGVELEGLTRRINDEMRSSGQQFWTEVIWVASSNGDVGVADQLVYDAAWKAGHEISAKLRIDDRHRNRTAWFAPFREPPWSPRRRQSDTKSPPIVAFMSFKGGIGRTTALASFALQRARIGERVVVIDFDLDAPGVGTLLATDEVGTVAPWGVIDYMLERSLGDVPLQDYMHYSLQEVAGNGSIIVFPAGRVNDEYLNKLARLDLELGEAQVGSDGISAHPLELLLQQIRDELEPSWILIDARAGLSPAAGLIMNGLAHLYVLFSTTSEQSFIGLERMVHRLGAERLTTGAQAECIVVQAMLPENPAVASQSQEIFRARVEEIFRDHYLVADDPKEELWALSDIGNNAEAPIVPVEIPYSQQVAFFSSIKDIADTLCQGHYIDLAKRIQGRFPLHPEEDN